MKPSTLREGIGIALEALWSNRVRSSLTVLGIVVGVATVMLMAAVIGGIRASVMSSLEEAGAKNFMVWRFDPEQIRLMGTWEEMWGDNPRLTLEDRDRIAAVPSVAEVSAFVFQDGAKVKLGATEAAQVWIGGLEVGWPRFYAGDFVAGRNFLRSEQERSASVVVISEPLARRLKPDGDPVGEAVRIHGEEFRVVGVYRPSGGLLGASDDVSVWVPVTTALRRLDMPEDFLRIHVVPTASASLEEAVDEVTVALRMHRSLRARDETNFVIRTNQAEADSFDRWSSGFLLVMVALSSIGLIVGGVGVVAIMMISVTERTREIGVRKALGATRREILWQFLVESTTVTVIGGAMGMLAGGGFAMLLSAATSIPAAVPLWAVAAALGVSVLSGVGFGLYPASKAARLDPIEALRHE